MTPADRIRAAIAAEFQRSPVSPTTDDLAAAVCEALADVVVPGSQSTDRLPGPLLTGDRLWCDSTAAIIRREILAIAAELRGEVRNGELEGNHPAKPDSSAPAGSLVEVVRQAQGCGNERDARAAIRAVASWIHATADAYPDTCGALHVVADQLEQEADG